MPNKSDVLMGRSQGEVRSASNLEAKCLTRVTCSRAMCLWGEARSASHPEAKCLTRAMCARAMCSRGEVRSASNPEAECLTRAMCSKSDVLKGKCPQGDVPTSSSTGDVHTVVDQQLQVHRAFASEDVVFWLAA